jgi:hypothetical protein
MRAMEYLNSDCGEVSNMEIGGDRSVVLEVWHACNMDFCASCV